MSINKLSTISNIFLALGIALFGYLIWSFGIDNIWSNLGKTGVWFVPITLVWLLVFILNTVSWRFILKDRFQDMGFGRALMITISGFAFNYITPVVNLGGEPLKIMASHRYLGTKPATSSVILYTLLHQYAHFWTWIAASIWFAFNMPLDNNLNLIILILTVLGVSLLIYLFSVIFKKGMIVYLFRQLSKVPFLKKFLVKYKDKERSLAKVDVLMTDFYNNRRRDFFIALFTEIAGRVMISLEFYFILRSINVEISFLESFYIMAASSLFVNIVFFVPMQMGAKEASLYFILNSLGINPFLGVYTAIVVRLREFAWIGIGILFIKLIGFEGKPTKSVFDYMNHNNINPTTSDNDHKSDDGQSPETKNTDGKGINKD